ncbi:hypothetical protein [Intrasporangium sp.]|uniref:hypothetical protein n=1 Tax=Intrasporangium sp. TaxID=1925024 RepID=UPI00293A8F3F|nr:hypothetical protein [Intrasporangium sp.]MDV3220416.1 hypothetical protein [Intrasporangium sp.]
MVGITPAWAYFSTRSWRRPSEAKKTAFPAGAGLVAATTAEAVAAEPAAAGDAGDALGAAAEIQTRDAAATIAVVTAGRLPNRDTRLLLDP